MRILLFSDLHLDSAFAIAGQREAARRRRQSIRDTLVRIVDTAIDEGVEIVCCGGDLYEHDRVTLDTAALLRAEFARLDQIPVLIAPGNHDWFGPDSLYAQNPWTPNVHVFSDAVLGAHTVVDGLTIWGAAHTKPAGTGSFLDDFAVDRGGIHIALFHGSERHALMDPEEGKQPHAPFDADQIRAGGLQHAMVGHYHKPKHDAWLTYPGNPTPLAFGEVGERGAAILDIDDSGSVRHRIVNVACGQARDVGLDLSGVSNANEIREQVSAAIADSVGAVRLRLSGEIPLDVDFQVSDLLDLGNHLDTFVVDTKDIHRALNVAEFADEQTVRGEFVRLVREGHLLPSEEERVILTGLRALEGRDDLDVG